MVAIPLDPLQEFTISKVFLGLLFNEKQNAKN